MIPAAQGPRTASGKALLDAATGDAPHKEWLHNHILAIEREAAKPWVWPEAAAPAQQGSLRAALERLLTIADGWYRAEDGWGDVLHDKVSVEDADEMRDAVEQARAALAAPATVVTGERHSHPDGPWGTEEWCWEDHAVLPAGGLDVERLARATYRVENDRPADEWPEQYAEYGIRGFYNDEEWADLEAIAREYARLSEEVGR